MSIESNPPRLLSRRSFLKHASLLLGLVLSTTSLAAQWNMFMGSAAHSGRAEAPAAVNWQKIQLQWHFPLHTQVSASPVVAAGKLWIAGENGNLYCFDLGQRKLLWIYHLEAGIGSTPAVQDGRIFFLGRDGFFYGLSTAGQLLWRFATAGERRFASIGGYGLPAAAGPVVDPWDIYQSSPLVVDGLVYFGSSDRQVYALKVDTGELVWGYTTDELIHSSPAGDGDTIYIASWGTRLYALDAKTGAEKWQFQAGAERRQSIMLGFQASPSVDNTQVYIGARDGFFYALDKTSGKLKWRYNAQGSWVVSTAAIDEGAVYFGTSDTGLALALDKKSGSELLRAPTKTWTYTSPVLLKNEFVVGTMAGELIAIDKRSGELVWRYRTPEALADIHQLLDQQGKLRSDKLFDSKVQLQASVEWAKTLGAFMASPIWVNKQLIAVDANGNILQFAERD